MARDNAISAVRRCGTVPTRNSSVDHAIDRAKALARRPKALARRADGGMKKPSFGSRSAWVGLSCLSSLGCGASMEAVYEGEVRFEHCMALDARHDVTPALRRACWSEWVSEYHFGQSHDRLDHARTRVDELGSLATTTRDDGGALEPLTRDDPARVEPNAVCAGTCEAVRDDCAESCAGRRCERGCAIGFQRCMLSCG